FDLTLQLPSSVLELRTLSPGTILLIEGLQPILGSSQFSLGRIGLLLDEFPSTARRRLSSDRVELVHGLHEAVGNRSSKPGIARHNSDGNDVRPNVRICGYRRAKPLDAFLKSCQRIVTPNVKYIEK